MTEESKPKILIFIDWFSPGYKAGGPISSNVNMLAHLKREYDFKIITRNTDYTETTPYKDVTPNKWIEGIEGSEIYYFSKNNLNYRNIKKLVNKTDFDIAYINGIYSWYFSILPLWLLSGKQKKVIISARGMLSTHALSVKSLKKIIYIYLAKAMGLYINITFHATNENERNEIKKFFNTADIKIAPNLPRKMCNITFKNKTKIQRYVKLVNIARIAPEKNTLYLLDVLTLITSNQINIELDLYGSIYNKEYWSSCLETIKRIPSNIKVQYKGAVSSNDVLTVLSDYHFMFMPTRGENYGHIIIESLSVGCPVIISDQTPWKDLQKISCPEEQQSSIINHQSSISVGWDLPLDNLQRWVEVIEYCCKMEQEEYNIIRRNAFNYAQSIINDPKVLEVNKKLFE